MNKELTDEEKFVIKNNEVYREYVSKLIRKVKVIRLAQLAFFIKNAFNLSSVEAEYLIYSLQAEQRLIISTDSLVMTLDYYRTVTNDKFFDGLLLNDKENVLPYPFYDIVKQFDKDIEDKLNTLTIVANFLPSSRNFVFDISPWTASFVVKEDEKFSKGLYQIYCVHATTASSEIKLLKEYSKDEQEELKDVIKRIVIVDNEEFVKYIPKVGVKFICIVDKNNLKILEKRSGNLWED